MPAREKALRAAFLLREYHGLDNQPCSAATYEVTGSGLSAVGECGMRAYTLAPATP